MRFQFSSLDAMQMVTEDSRGGRWLMRLAWNVQEKGECNALDPIHFIAAAMDDPHRPSRIADLLLHYGVIEGLIERALPKAESVAHSTTVGENGERVAFTNDYTKQLFTSLAMRFNAYMNGPTDHGAVWDWYVAVIQLALESESPSLVELQQEIDKIKRATV